MTEPKATHYLSISKKEINDHRNHLVACLGLIEAIGDMYKQSGEVNPGSWGYAYILLSRTAVWLTSLDDDANGELLPF